MFKKIIEKRKLSKNKETLENIQTSIDNTLTIIDREVARYFLLKRELERAANDQDKASVITTISDFDRSFNSIIKFYKERSTEHITTVR